MRSLTIAGDDQPLPGIGFFQTTFDFGLHSVGSATFERPSPVGPRNSVQSSARRGEEIDTIRTATAKRFMRHLGRIVSLHYGTTIRAALYSMKENTSPVYYSRSA